MQGHGALNLAYYENEFGYSSYQPPLGEIKLSSSTSVKKHDVLHERWIQIGSVKEQDEELRFICPSAAIQASWYGELARGIAYLRYLNSDEGRAARKSAVPALRRGLGQAGSSSSSGSNDAGMSFDDANDAASTASTVSSSESDINADDMTLDSLMKIATTEDDKEEVRKETLASIRESGGNEKEGGELEEPPKDDVFTSKENERGALEMVESPVKKRTLNSQSTKGFDIDVNPDNYCAVVEQLESKIKSAANFSTSSAKKNAKKQLLRVKKLARIVYNWCKFVIKIVLIKYARLGLLPNIKRFIEIVPDTECFHDMFHNDDVLPNLARAATRNGHKDLLKWLVEKKGVDVNIQNRMGFPLITFASMLVVSGGKFEVGEEMLRFMVEDLGADVNARNVVGQSMLFFCAGRMGASIEMFELLVRKYKMDPRELDKFNCSILHTAVLFGHLDFVKYLYDKNYAIQSRAKWSKLMDMYESISFLSPDVLQAKMGWRARGLVKYANDASPLGVAILHNNGRMAKYLMGFGSKTPECSKRKSIFANSCQDLEMVALAWPELLPDVLNSFEMINIETTSKGQKTSGGFVEAKYCIADILGDPAVPTVLCPLAIFCRANAPDVFDTPILRLIIKLKWETFGKRRYFLSSLPYLCLCFCFWFGFIFDRPIARYISYGITLFLLLYEELRELLVEGPSLFLKNLFNYLSVPAYLGVLYVGFRKDVLKSSDFDNVSDHIVLAFR